jgi:ketosteroid isomerase-like protein
MSDPGATRSGESPVAEGQPAREGPNIEAVVGRFHAALENRDVEGALTLFAEDAVWTLSPGDFYGKEGVRKVLEWDARLSSIDRTRPAGIGLVVIDDLAIEEATVEEEYDGIRYEYACVRIFEFDDDRRIRRLRDYYDKLAIEQQVAARYPGLKGWIFRRIINMIVAEGEKGLR